MTTPETTAGTTELTQEQSRVAMLNQITEICHTALDNGDVAFVVDALKQATTNLEGYK
jgi:hypothetical protein